MAIYLDDEPLGLSCSDWGALLDAAQSRAETAGRVIVEVRSGQRVYAVDELNAMRSQAIGDDEIRIYSADLRELAVTALREIITRLDEARTAQAQAADLIQRGQTKESMTPIATAIEVWQQAHAAVAQVTQGFGIDASSLTLDGQSMASFLPAMVDALRSLRDMLTLNDWVGVADALGHDWPAMTDRGQRLISALAQRVMAR